MYSMIADLTCQHASYVCSLQKHTKHEPAAFSTLGAQSSKPCCKRAAHDAGLLNLAWAYCLYHLCTAKGIQAYTISCWAALLSGLTLAACHEGAPYGLSWTIS